jgi:tRNA-splicing ligase RtcB
MTTYDADGITLQKVREHVWEIPQEGEMGAPARVLASEALLEEIADDRTLQQLTNATQLPGVQKQALCMPDGHQGYGFPVGGVAGIDAESGCISPGAVGFDINCLAGDAEVSLEFGRRMAISDLADRFENERAVVAADRPVDSDIVSFAETSNETVYEVETEHGEVLETTADHPLRTPSGMQELSDLDVGDRVSVAPFQGLEHEPPEEFIVLTEADFDDEDPQLLDALRERDLLPLKSTDREFNHLLKLVGFHTGDGSFGGHGQTWFYADREDLESIRGDIRAVGFTPSKIYSRERQHTVKGNSFTRAEHGIKATANAFRQLLLKLGVPAGQKVDSEFTTPEYLERLSGWQRALYLSAFFGTEMSAPAALSKKNLYCPKISQSRGRNVADAGEQFMQEIAEHLADLGIETNRIERFEADSPTRPDMLRYRLGIKNDSDNLLRFYSTVGYRYNLDKQRRATKAILYLQSKERAIERRERIATDAVALVDGGTPAKEIKRRFDINDRFIERSIWGGRSGRPRPPMGFPDFEDFCEEISVHEDLTVDSEIVSVSESGRKTVYDIGVAHEAHNFVANGFVVSNCGVRMVRTNLTYDDVQGHERELVEELFDAIPSGLGGGGVLETEVSTVEAVLERGVDWAREAGYATEGDLAHCEDEGRREEADADAVSGKAKDRGKNQLGSLGSGNHFLEVQRVTDVFREEVGEAYGLSEEDIVVLIHCGSRGLGHQVCTDYVRRIEEAHPELLDELPDKDLAAAPAGSDLAEEYYRAMGAAINFAWVNRQLITHRTRQAFEEVFDTDWEALGMELLYDVAHNIAKKETHNVDGEDRELYVHRKGATRAFPAGRPEVPDAYREVGQPVIIPGSMGAGSYVLRGGEDSLEQTFGSTAHGAGRTMSRTQAKQDFWGEDVQDDLEGQQVYVKAQSGATIAEEAPGVYKDVDEVVRVSEALGIGDPVARTFPVCNIKG